MSSIDDYCQDCLKELGKEYRQVHEWLDELCGKVPNHHQCRHHENGLQYIEFIWEKKARRAGEIHIIKDLGGIPRDSVDYLDGDKSKWRKLSSP